MKNQLNGKTIKAHAGHLKLLKIHDWEIQITATGKPWQKANLVIAPDSEDSEELICLPGTLDSFELVLCRF